MEKITYCEAINKTLHWKMEKDKTIIVCGIGVPDHKNVFGSTEGLQKKFGKNRVFDTPLSEDAMTGFCIGMAMNGMKPIHIHIRADFALLAINQIINMASSVSYISNNQLKCPIVIRIIIGRGWGQGFQHSKSLFSLFTHIPGLKVIAPSTPSDVIEMLSLAIIDNNPVICFEHRWLYWQNGIYNNDFEHVLPYYSSKNILSGKDITIVSYSWGIVESMQAARVLKDKHNIYADVVDLRVLSPLDTKYIIDSIEKTHKLLIVEDDWLSNSVGSNLIAILCEKGVLSNVQVKRVGWENIPCPTARHLENKFYYSAETIIRKAERMFGLSKSDLSDVDFHSHENKFIGPF